MKQSIIQILLLILIIQISLAFQTSQEPVQGVNIDDYLGEYEIKSKCNTIKCPKTTVGDVSFSCPANGDSGRIELQNSDKGIYVISFDAYNALGQNEKFEANFTKKDITTNNIGFSYIQIDMNSPYELLIEPCYIGSLTHEVCSTADNFQLAVWKIKGNSSCSDCAFTMTKID